MPVSPKSRNTHIYQHPPPTRLVELPLFTLRKVENIFLRPASGESRDFDVNRNSSKSGPNAKITRSKTVCIFDGAGKVSYSLKAKPDPQDRASVKGNVESV
jgi:hypothetical protein